MSLVWDDNRLGGSRKLVMLAMADWCNDAGGSLFPSNNQVAKKCCISERQVIRILNELTAAGYLHVISHDDGGRSISKDYLVDIEKLRNHEIEVKGDILSPNEKIKVIHKSNGKLSTKGDILSRRVTSCHPERVTSATVKGDMHVRGYSRLSTSKPSLKRERDAHARASAVDNSLSLSSSKEKKIATRLPENWELSEDMGRWAEKETGFAPRKILKMSDQFKDHWLSIDGEKGISQDWNARWRNWVRREKA